MNYVRIFRSGNVKRLEEDINSVLATVKHDLVDIKYSSSYNDNVIVHTAILIFKRRT